MNYKPLAKELKKKGMYYKEVWRKGDFCIYGVGNSKESFLGYECFEVKKHDGYVIAGNKVEAAEMFASDEDFGVSAFFVKDMDRAKLRIDQLKDMKRLRDKAKQDKINNKDV